MKTLAALVLAVAAIALVAIALLTPDPITVPRWLLFIVGCSAALLSFYCWDPLGPFDPDADEHQGRD